MTIHYDIMSFMVMKWMGKDNELSFCKIGRFPMERFFFFMTLFGSEIVFGIESNHDLATFFSTKKLFCFMKNNHLDGGN